MTRLPLNDADGRRLASPIGRDDDIDRVLTLVERGRSVVVCGEAGVGKTAFVEHVVDAVEQRSGMPVWRIFANDVLREVPLGALAGSLPARAFDRDDDGALTAVTSVGAVLARSGPPVLVWVDDAPDLDPLSAQAFSSAIVDGTAVIVATQRDGTALAGPLARHVESGRIERIEIGPLSPADTVALAGAVAGLPVDRGSTGFLSRMTGGNPRVVREFVAATLEQEPAPIVEDAIVLDRMPVGVTRLDRMLAERLAPLATTETEALHAIAATEPIGVGHLRGLVDIDAIESLARGRLVRLDRRRRDVVASVASPLIGHLVRAGSALTSSRWEVAVARQILNSGTCRADDSMRAVWWLSRNDCQVDVPLLIDGCRHATARGELAIAIDLGRAAYGRGPSFETGQALEFALRKQGDPRPLDAHLRDWKSHVSTSGERAAYLSAVGHAAFFRHGDLDTARRLIADADSTDDASAANWLRAIASCTLLMAGKTRRAVDVAESVMNDLLDAEPGEPLVYATIALGHALGSLGRPTDALAACDRSIEVFRSIGPPGDYVADGVLGNVRSQALTLLGRFEDAAASVDRAIDAAERAGDPTTIGLAHAEAADLARARDDHRRAVESGDRAVALLDDAHQVGLARSAAIGVAVAAALSGDRDRAVAALADVESRATSTMAVLDSVAHRATAWIAWQDGNLSSALDSLRAGARHATDTGNVVNRIMVLHDLARLGHADEAVRLLDARPADVQGDLLRAHTDAIRARSTGRPDDLATCAQRLATIGCLQAAVECAELAAEAHGRTGRREAANNWLKTAGQWRSSLGPTVSTWVPDGPVVALTPRQREIALAAASGESSREIATRLSISPRTVESHLARVYVALGVHDRAALARAINVSSR